MDASTIIQKLLSSLEQGQYPPSSAPVGLDKGLETFRSDEVSKLFVTKGFWAWLAYFFADEPTRQSLSTFSETEILQVADQVTKVKVNDSVNGLVQHTFYRSSRASQRRRLLEQLGIRDLPLQTHDISEPSALTSHPFISPPSPTVPNLAKRRRIDLRDDWCHQSNGTRHDSWCSLASDTGLQRNEPNTTSRSNDGQINTGLDTFGDTSFVPFAINPECDYVYPDASYLPFVFQAELGDMIIKRDSKASVLLSFGLGPDHCKILVDIEAPGVVYVALKFFDERIEEKRQQRAIVSPRGTRAVLLGNIRFENTEVKAWEIFLGELLINGVRHSPQRLEEVAQGKMLSTCLTVEIPPASNCPARLVLAVDPNTAAEVRARLWPRQHQYTS
ncbi:hypothetical protein FOQG_18105 [Fusarium oxysporum f. sp. raphani 54005]|uniref:Uncharacterized protein n=1 Tax=Fusarium oxysporum f. sp. raphani 54005 TaxID=1089458 RepID=X0BFF2_FUSOX|nr:hypothetical protein FOQG_18105 [Fusarium oxysporum f. sp. raphani 54005]